MYMKGERKSECENVCKKEEESQQCTCNKDKERKGVCLTVKASVWVNGQEIQKF